MISQNRSDSCLVSTKKKTKLTKPNTIKQEPTNPHKRRHSPRNSQYSHIPFLMHIVDTRNEGEKIKDRPTVAYERLTVVSGDF